MNRIFTDLVLPRFTPSLTAAMQDVLLNAIYSKILISFFTVSD